MIMSNPEQENNQKYSGAKALVGISLVVPWVVIDMVLKKQDPSLGYSFGIFLGFLTSYLLGPQPERLWVMVLVAAALAVSHFLLAPR
jgi:multisubunit Na+/H+ antiporter MnhE subunit